MARELKCDRKIFRDTWIRSLRSDCRLQIVDAMTPGLHLRYSPVSRKKVFYLNYRLGNVQRNLRIGQYGEFSLDDIRRRAMEYKGMLSDGIDPMLKKQEQIKKQKIELASQIKISKLLDEYHENYSKLRKSEKTVRSEYYVIKKRIKPELGDINIGDLDLAKISDFYDKVAKETCFQTADNHLSVITSFWNWCERKNLLPINSNPSRHVQRGKDAKKPIKTLDLKEYKKLMAAMDDGINGKSPYNTRAFRALKILMLTGCRESEITTLKKSNLDLDNNFLHLDRSKNDSKDIPLNSAAIAEIRKALADAPKDSEYIFPPSKQISNKSVINLRKPHMWALKHAGLAHMRTHDFRHSIVSAGVEYANLNAYDVSKAIGHKKFNTTEGYMHLTNKKRVETMQKIGDVICGI